MGELGLRETVFDDARMLLRWTNDPVTRQNSFHTEPIKWEEHIDWLSGKLKDENCYFYMLCDEAKAYGTIRLDYIPNECRAMVSFSIAPENRGKGLGTLMLKLIWSEAEKLVCNGIDLQSLIGEVKKSNKASCRCFIKNGYFLKREEKDRYVYERTI